MKAEVKADVKKRCSKCGEPAVVELVCPNCNGKGQYMPIGVYRPLPCRECSGTGKQARCEEHKGTET